MGMTTCHPAHTTQGPNSSKAREIDFLSGGPNAIERSKGAERSYP